MKRFVIAFIFGVLLVGLRGDTVVRGVSNVATITSPPLPDLNAPEKPGPMPKATPESYPPFGMTHYLPGPNTSTLWIHPNVASNELVIHYRQWVVRLENEGGTNLLILKGAR